MKTSQRLSVGVGNPHAKSVQRLRSALLDAVSPDDIRAVVGKLIELATGGDVQAARLLLDRACGKLSVAGAANKPADGDGESDVKQDARNMLLSMRGASNVG